MDGAASRERPDLTKDSGRSRTYKQSLSGGTLLTQKLCMREKKPVIALDAQAMTKRRAASAIVRFVDEQGISVLNIAGPRLSGWPAGYRFALGVVGAVISSLQGSLVRWTRND